MIKVEKYNSGIYRESNINSISSYKYFCPSNINDTWTWDDIKLNNLLVEASKALGEFNGYSEQIPDIDIFIKMYIRIEANKSNKIEGTKTTLDEELMNIADLSPEKRDDYIEVQNYIKAMNLGIEKVKTLPISSRLIKELHKTLLKVGRGESKQPGEFRHSQNWIGGSSIKTANYVPPSHEMVNDYMTDLEKFINNEINTPHLIKVAIIHYQFESIHPFLDGNGRIGRLLIPLYLLYNKELNNPCFYISDYIEGHKEDYYNCLELVRTKNDMSSWIKFFLTAVIETCKDSKEKFIKVIGFIKDLEKDEELMNSTIKKIINYAYSNPNFSRAELSEKLQIHRNSVSTCIKKLIEKGLIEEITGYSKNQIFTFTKYLDQYKK